MNKTLFEFIFNFKYDNELVLLTTIDDLYLLVSNDGTAYIIRHVDNENLEVVKHFSVLYKASIGANNPVHNMRHDIFSPLPISQNEYKLASYLLDTLIDYLKVLCSVRFFKELPPLFMPDIKFKNGKYYLNKLAEIEIGNFIPTF